MAPLHLGASTERLGTFITDSIIKALSRASWRESKNDQRSIVPAPHGQHVPSATRGASATVRHLRPITWPRWIIQPLEFIPITIWQFACCLLKGVGGTGNVAVLRVARTERGSHRWGRLASEGDALEVGDVITVACRHDGPRLTAVTITVVESTTLQ
jgi:hypothetical protein